MSKNNENKLVPRLRFPEFENAGEWLEKKLKDVCEINPKVSQLPDIFVYIDLESVDKGKLLQKKIINRVEAPSRAQRLLDENDVIFQTVRPYQKNNYYFKKTDDYDYVASTGYAQLRAFESSMFLFQLIHTDSFVSKVLKKCSGSNYPAINSSDLSKISVEIPNNPEEQQKIASCLSSLDEVITAESQKLELYQQHKKGLLQNLFPQEGETVPKLRFKEFKESGEWVEKTLGEICDVRDGTHDSPKYVSQGYPLVTSKNLMSNGMIDFINVDYLTEYDYNQINKRSKVDVGDILFGMIGTIGNPVIVRTDGFAIKNVALIKSQGVLNQEFLVYQFKSDFIEKQFGRVNAGGILKFIALGMIRNLDIFVPNLAEQQKIASCLSSIDDLINAQRQKIELLKQHKKGLLQGLFPPINN